MNLREQIAELREQTADKKGKSTADISREQGFEIQLRVAAQWGFTEDATDPMVAPQDCDVRQSGRVLELQNSDLWLRPTDLSWHFPIREEEHPKNGRPSSRRPLHSFASSSCDVSGKPFSPLLASVGVAVFKTLLATTGQLALRRLC